MVTWIKEMFIKFCGTVFRPKAITKRYDSNVYNLTITHKKARGVLRELSLIPNQLDRKWDGILELCDNYRDPRIKLTLDEVRCIIGRIANGETQRAIARDYDIHQVTVSQINLKKLKWLQELLIDEV